MAVPTAWLLFALLPATVTGFDPNSMADRQTIAGAQVVSFKGSFDTYDKCRAAGKRNIALRISAERHSVYVCINGQLIK